MSLKLRILQIQDLEKILKFEEKKRQDTVLDEIERTFAAWNSKARKESLEHYLPLGWSFVAEDLDLSEPTLGYFLAQPLLFLDGQTQSLWVEHLQFNSIQVRDQLCELIYKLGREKHFQKVYYPQTEGVQNSIQIYKPSPWNPLAIAVQTTKVG